MTSFTHKISLATKPDTVRIAIVPQRGYAILRRTDPPFSRVYIASVAAKTQIATISLTPSQPARVPPGAHFQSCANQATAANSTAPIRGPRDIASADRRTTTMVALAGPAPARSPSSAMGALAHPGRKTHVGVYTMDMQNVGGTPGGMRTFLLGLIMAGAGGYLLFQQVQVNGGYWNWSGLGGTGRSFGITLLPLLFGVGILFVNGKSFAGRFLTFGGALVIVVGIIANLDIHFQQTSLWNTLTMLVLLVGGIGLVARSVLPMGKQTDDKAPPER